MTTSPVLTIANISPTLAFDRYKVWLTSQPLAPNTLRAYRGRVNQYCIYLSQHSQAEYGDPLQSETARDYAVRDYRNHLKSERGAKPSSIKLTLSALDHFYRFLGLSRPDIRREQLPQAAPKALESGDQKRLLRALERRANSRDRAVVLLLFYTGLRIGECAALDLADITLSSRKGMCRVQPGKTATSREVPLNVQVRDSMQAWLNERIKLFPTTTQTALFLNRQGERLTTRAIDMLLRKVGREAGLTFSAHTLRHTCLTNLVRTGNDLVLVAEIAGHKRLETTRRYSLPNEQDRMDAMERLQVEY